MKKTHARPGGADHLRQHLLTECPNDRFRPAFLAEIRQEKEKSGEALFARIEQLIDQVFFNATAPSQQIGHEQLGKSRLIVDGRDHGRLVQASDHAFIDRSRCPDAQRMAIQASFAKKLAGSQDRNDRFLALLGNDGELDLALLDIKDRFRNLTL